MKKYRILVLSRAGFEKINRAVYRELSESPEIDLHLIVPSSIEVGKSIHLKKPVFNEPFPMSTLDPVGDNLRLQRLSGLRDFIEKFQPTHVLAEWDPASLVAWDILHAKNASSFETWFLTCENLPKNYWREVRLGLVQLKLRRVLKHLIILGLTAYSRKRVAKIFTINEAGSRFLRHLGYKEVVQIPLGYDPAFFYKQSPTKIRNTRKRLNLELPTFGFFGRIAPEKGLDLFLDALSRIEHLPWQFLIDRFREYDSPYAQALQSRLKTLPWKKRIVVFSAKHHEISDYMNAVDFVVLPSRELRGITEQYGRVLAEAMACGKIVIGSQCGAIPQIIGSAIDSPRGSAGYLFPENNIDRLTECLTHVLRAPRAELAKMRSNAMKRAQEELSTEKQAAIWRAHLRGAPTRLKKAA